MNNTKEARELNPNQDLKINAGLMQMWKKAGLRIKSFKATKKGHNEIWAGKFKSKNAVLEMSVDKYGNVFYHAGNKSVNIGKLDKQRKIIEWMKAIIRNAPWAESVNEGPGRELPPQKYVVYTGFGSKRKIVKKGLSYDNALKLHNKIEKLGKHDDYGMDNHRDWNDKNGKQIKESVKEATFDSTGVDWSGEMMWKWVSKALKSAGIKELKYSPMKSGWLGGKFVWGGFYTVQANKRKDVLPFTVDKKGNLHLNVSPKKFIIGKIGKLPQVVKNLKDFKKSDLDVYESVNEASLPSNIQRWISARGPKPAKDVKMINKWVKKLTGRGIVAGVSIGKNYNTLVLDIEYQDAAIHYDTTSGEIKLYKKKIRNFNDFKKVFQANESVNEDIVRGNEVHAKTKKELKTAIARSMKEILTGKTPKYDIINGMTGEMIGWKDGKEYIWQPHAIPDAMRELK